jgi:hypothetical protein
MTEFKTTAPRPLTPLRGGHVWHTRDNHIKVPTDLPLYYPTGLEVLTRSVINDAVKAFPSESQMLEICRKVISQLTPAYRDEIEAKRLQAYLAPGAMNDLLGLLVRSNCHSSEERDLTQQLMRSDEWRNFIRTLAQSTEVQSSVGRRTRQTGQSKPNRLKAAIRTASRENKNASQAAIAESVDRQFENDKINFRKECPGTWLSVNPKINSLTDALQHPIKEFRNRVRTFISKSNNSAE